MKQVPVSKEHFASVNDEDYPLVIQYRWSLQRGGKNVYAVAYIGGKRVLMHRLIMNASAGTLIDHADGDGLNNRRENLRFCTRAQNFQNGRWRNTKGRTSRYKGVWLIKEGCQRCWRAGITANRVYRNLGTYWTEEEAARTYDAAARVFHGDFARLNFSQMRRTTKRSSAFSTRPSCVRKDRRRSK